MHHGTGSQCGDMPALGTTPALAALVPILMRVAAFAAYNALGYASLIKILLTGLFVWEALGKFD